jgi:probable F420-dependent oxidoreductase
VAIRFGVGLPSCREGTAYPAGFVRPGDFAALARRAEALGYYSLWANDHLTTPRVIQKTQTEAPSFYEPLITYAALASVTERLKLVLSVVVLPEREPVLLAKQLATLDVLSGGRLMLGVGIGAYREEFEAVHPALAGANRGAMLEEGMLALRLLFDQPRASFDGRYLRFREVELAPKPLQRPFPILLNAHASAALARVGRLANGWIVAGLPPERLVSARQEVEAAAVAAGRSPDEIGVHAQLWICIGEDDAAAEDKLRRTQHFRRSVALHPEHSEQAVLARYRATNLLGSPADVEAQLRTYVQAGLDHLGLVFLAETPDELLADVELFAERVMPAFAPGTATLTR